MWIAFALLWAGFGAFGGWVAAQKGRAVAEGAAVGFLFGPAGVIVEALLPPGSPRPPASRRPGPLTTDAPDQPWLAAASAPDAPDPGREWLRTLEPTRSWGDSSASWDLHAPDPRDVTGH